MTNLTPVSGLDRCACGHIRDNHVSKSGTCLLGGCTCGHFELPEMPEMCWCGHPRTDHGGNGGYCRTCALTAQRWYCPGFRSITPNDTPYDTKTGDTTMSDDLTYSQVETLRYALDWITGELHDNRITWNELASLPVSAILDRYTARQRAILAELTAVNTMLTSPASKTLENINASWGSRADREREETEGELHNTERMLELLTAPEPTAPAPCSLCGK